MGSERPGGCAIYAEALGEVEGECPRCGHAWCCAPISAHKLPLGMPADVSLPSTFLGSETPARAEAPVGVCEAKAAPSSCSRPGQRLPDFGWQELSDSGVVCVELVSKACRFCARWGPFSPSSEALIAAAPLSSLIPSAGASSYSVSTFLNWN